MLRKNLMFITFVAVLIGIASMSLAGEDNDLTRAGPLSCPDTNTNMVYRMSYVSTGNEYPDTVTDKFYVTWRIANDSLVRLDMKIKWNPAELSFVSWAEGPGFPPNDTATTVTTTGDSTLTLVTKFLPFVFDSTQAVLHVNLRTKCYALNDTAEVSFTTGCEDNWFLRKLEQATPFRPVSSNLKTGGVILAVTPADTMHLNADVVEVEIGDTVKVPVKYKSNLTASNTGTGSDTLSFVARFKWDDDSLKFIRIDTAGTLSSGKTLRTQLYGTDSLRVRSPSTFPRRLGSDTTLMTLVFLYNPAVDYRTAIVTHTADTVFTGCQHVKSTYTDCYYYYYCNFYALIPRYGADIYFKDMSLNENTSGQLKEELTNNFTVDMTTADDPDSLAAFRGDTTTFDLVQWNGTFSSSFTSGNLTFKWRKDNVTGGFVIKEDGSNPSNDIPKTSTKREIAQVGISAGGTTGGDPVQFTRDTTGQILVKRDSKLKSYNRNVTIYSYNDPGVDSLFRLQGGTVTVTPGGGGCPFVYTWDGNKFVEDNTILTSSEFSPFSTPVTDLYKLTQPMVESNGEYLLQVKEFENEETQLDEVELIAVDHPPAVRVGVTLEGKILAYDKILLPVSCTDNEGKDQLELITKRDGMLFESKGPGYLLLTFNNPKSKEFSNYLRPVAAESTDIPCGPPECPPKRIGVNNRVLVELEDSEDHWHTLGTVAPRANADKPFWVLGSTDVQLGEQFRVRISWSLDYQADWLRFYMPTEQPWSQEDIRLMSAVHSKKGDISEGIVAADGNSTKLLPGESINLKFPVGSPKAEGMVRDFVFKAVGYYKRYYEVSTAGPVTYKLNNNYPNPFNAQTEIQYALPEPAEINLSVYNIMGQKVRTLVEGRQPAGVHKVIWDGKNEKGETVASGVYLYSIRAGTYIETKKMTLLK